MPHQRHPKGGIGAWQTLLRTPIVDSERLAKEAAGRGLTRTLLPRNVEEEETQHEEKEQICEETRWPGRVDVAWDWNLTDQIGLGPVI